MVEEQIFGHCLHHWTGLAVQTNFYQYHVIYHVPSLVRLLTLKNYPKIEVMGPIGRNSLPSTSNKAFGNEDSWRYGSFSHTTPHRSLNSSRGVISEDDSDIQIKVLLLSNASPFIASPTKHLILVFEKLTLPSLITGYLCCPCGTEGHDSTKCKSTPCCVNCKDAHPAYSRKCPTWQRERDSTGKNCDHHPISRGSSHGHSKCTMEPKTFAAVLKSTKTCGVQTDISVSPSESLTHHAKCLLIPPT
ncbi:uncharacterized protein LOC111641233 [Centruroides sculpturatus]|uniref:uncharacterized protein LOC111641233 n=1 Tax=Centruroides sculpturatus TaxID=218467 RepID=UPI000C6E223D|nr:uncharacterized protein LOC111641233 [Centruroides sculpturatus]